MQQDRYDDAMLSFSRGDYETAAAALRALLAEDPDFFDARLALGMALCRSGDYAGAIAEGHRAEKLRPGEQLVHTNLSVFYVKAGDRDRAEHHAALAKTAAWQQMLREGTAAPSTPASDLQTTKPPSVKLPGKFPEMPWKKKNP